MLLRRHIHLIRIVIMLIIEPILILVIRMLVDIEGIVVNLPRVGEGVPVTVGVVLINDKMEANNNIVNNKVTDTIVIAAITRIAIEEVVIEILMDIWIVMMTMMMTLPTIMLH